MCRSGWKKSARRMVDSATEKIVKQLSLQPHPEGGWYRETYRSEESIPQDSLPERYSASRSISTCIYYLLDATTFSTMHLVQSDEIYHFYSGSPLELLLLLPDGTSRIEIIGNDIAAGHHPQFVIHRGWWQGSRVRPGGEYALIGATVAPGFDFADFAVGSRDELTTRWPDAADMIAELTHQA